MAWTTIGKIVLGVIASVGGIGVVFFAVIKFSSDIIADRLSKKYEMKMTKEIEAYKANIQNKTFISKTRFETEFNTYRRLSKVFSLMVKETSKLFPTITKDFRDDYEKYKTEYDRALDAFVVAQDELCACAPFISKEIYDDFYSLENLCKIQISDFQDFRLSPNAEYFRDQAAQEFRKTYKNTEEINGRLSELLEKIREYISKLDVIE